jgi:hypothetical protein
MKDIALRTVAFWIAIMAAGVALIGILEPTIGRRLIPSVTIVTTLVAVLLFVRILFSRTYRAGIDRANLEMKGDDPWPGKPKAFSDPVWGVLGTRWGDAPLNWLRAILVLGLLPIALLQAWVGTEVIYLWLAALRS